MQTSETYQPEASWNQPGTSLEPSWNQAGTKLEPSWNQAGTRLEPGWNQAGTQLEHSLLILFAVVYYHRLALPVEDINITRTMGKQGVRWEQQEDHEQEIFSSNDCGFI